MKNQLWTMLMVVLLGITVLTTAVLAFTYVQFTRKLNQLQYEVSVINQNRNRVQALLNEAVEYSRRNPAISPILSEMGIKPAPVPESTLK